ncbi:unnamed protein product (macronuclear) [Paramecium tetraurelia]|uniref:RING-type domain-containing protein n=1 Tax=Paramecium tetraurelia TaxID=5888 RepID=A0CPQ2_PARTE|nr:uncharacterized protein GSPATT00009161001 [Paramecium tetraurelia]CAK72769.1 unnamed protein product [Paramecium tetraurelia]|eukprot:XP_001440166.1 hypothetical protein (macronuclear) [Paramecium tetraurelia strain d4-2]
MRDEHSNNVNMKIWQLMFLQQISQSYQIIYLSYLIWKFDPLYLMSQYWMLDIFMLTALGLLKIKFKAIVNNLIMDTLIGSALKLLLLINVKYYQQFQIQYFSYAIMAYYFIRVLVQNVRKISNNQQISQYSFIVQGIKLLFVLQIMLITMKRTKAITWNWYSVFSISWGLLIISFIVYFVFLLSMGETIMDYVRNRTTKSQLIGGLWLSFYMNSFSILPMWFLLEVSWHEEANYSNTTQTLFFVLIVYNGIILLGLLLFFSYIKQYIIEIRYNTTNEKNETRQPQKFRQVDIPYKIVQISSTYFDIIRYQKNVISVNHSNQSVIHQKTKLKAFEFVGKTEQLQSPAAERELELIKQIEEKCQICYDVEPNIVLLPCQHGGLCEECIIKWLEKQKNCYICRQKIEKYLRIAKSNEDGKFTIRDIAMCD